MGALDDIPLATLSTSSPTSTPPKTNELAGIPLADTTLQDNYQKASVFNPDAAAKTQVLSKKLGTDPAWTSQNLDAAGRIANAPTPEYLDGLKSNHPITANLLSSPEHMAVAHDDIDNLRQHEGIVQSAVNALSYAKDQALLGSLQEERAFTRAGAIPGNVLGTDKYSATLRTGPYVAAAFGIGTQDQAERLRQLDLKIEEIQGRLPKVGLKGKALGTFASLVPLGIGTTGYAGAGGVAGTVVPGAGNVVGAAAGGMLYNYQYGIGAIASELDKVRDKQGKPLPQDLVNTMSIMGGALAAGGTTAAAKAMVGMLPKSVIAKMTSEIGEKAIQDAPTVMAWAKTFLTNSMKNVATGTAGMVEFAGSQTGSVELAKLVSPGQHFDYDFKGDLYNLGETAKQGALGFAAGAIVTSPLHLPEAIQARQAEAKQAELTKGIVTELNSASDASKVKGRMPELYQRFNQDVVKNTPLSDVWIDRSKIEQHLQSKGTDPSKQLQDMGIEKEYLDSKAQGPFVRVPTDKYLSLPDNLRKGSVDDLKLDPDHKTVNEIKAEQEEMRTQVQNQQLQVAQSDELAQRDDKYAKARDLIQQDIQKQLFDLGTPIKVAGAQSKVAAAMMANLAKQGMKEGETLEQSYQRIKGTIGQGEQPSEAMTQPQVSTGQISQGAIETLFSQPRQIAEFGPAAETQANRGIQEGGLVGPSSQDSIGQIAQVVNGPLTSADALEGVKKELLSEVENDKTTPETKQLLKGAVGKMSEAELKKEIGWRASNSMVETYMNAGNRMGEFNASNAKWIRDSLLRDVVRLKHSDPSASVDVPIQQLIHELNDIAGGKPNVHQYVDPKMVNVFTVHHGETDIDTPRPSPNREIEGISYKEQTHGNQFKGELLNEVGKTSIKRVAEQLKPLDLQNVYSASSKRTIQSGMAIGPNSIDSRFDAMDIGKMGGMPISEFKPQLEKALAEWSKNPYAKPLGDESFMDYQGRVLAAFKDMAKANKSGDNVGLALNSDSMHLLKLIAENDGKPLQGEQIKKMAEKENIQASTVNAIHYDPATGKIKMAGEDILKQPESNRFEQAAPEGEPRGFYDPTKDFISLGKNADPSTFMHEMAHKWLENAHDIFQAGQGDEQFRNDIQSIKKYIGAPEDAKEFTKDQHEKFAQSFEKYLQTGEAPTEALKPAFTRFKQWLTKIYRNVVGQLDVPLNKDIRAVFDRMVASEDEIQNAAKDAGYQSGQVAGLQDIKPEDQKRVRTLEERARQMAEDSLLRDQMKELTDDHKKFLQNKKEEFKVKRSEELANEPLTQAMGTLRELVGATGEERKAFGRDILPETIAQKYIDGKAGPKTQMYMDQLAELHGYSSGDELAQKITKFAQEGGQEAEINRRVQSDMAPYADLRNRDQIKAKALEAIHAGRGGELLAMEHSILTALQTGKEESKVSQEVARLNAQAVKEYAQQTLQNAPIKEAGNYRIYVTAERKAAERVTKALSNEDFEKAAQAKKEQLINHALAAEAYRNRDRIDKWTDTLQKAQTDKKELFKDQTHFNQVGELLRRFGFDRTDYDPKIRTEKLGDYVKRMEAEGNVPVIEDWLQDESNAKDYKELTADQLHDLRNAVKNIRNMANNQDTMWNILQGERLGAVVDQLGKRKQEVGLTGKTPGAGTYQTLWDKVIGMKDSIRQAVISPETFMDKMDGYKDGPWKNVFIESKARAEDARGKDMADAAKQWHDIHSEYSKKELAEMQSKPIFIPEMGESWTKENILTLAANQGTDSNKRVMLEGRGWTQDKVDAVLNREMTKRDWDLVQKRLDLVNSYRDRIGALYSKLAGFEPTWIDASKISTPHGDYKGGYYPLVPDTRVSARGFEAMKTDEALTDPPPSWKASTANGFTKARNQFAKYPVSLDSSGLIRHVADVIHDLNMREWVLDANRIMGNKEVSKDMVDALGMPQFQSLKDWVKQIAGNDIKPMRSGVDAVLGDLRRRSTVAMLGGKISVMLSQLHGVTAAAGVDPNNFDIFSVGKGIMETYGKMLYDPKSVQETFDFVHEKSDYMSQRRREADRDISDAARKTWGHDDTIMHAAMWGFGKMDSLITTPIWKEAYKTGLKLNRGDDAAAVAYADKIIRNAGSSGRKSDLPEVMRSGEVGKLFTMFHGFVNAQAQLMYRASGRVESIKDIPQFIGTAMNVMAIPGAMYAITHYGAPTDDKSKKQWAKVMARSLSPISYIPIAATMQDWMLDDAMGLKGSAAMTPGSAPLEAVRDAFAKVESRKAQQEKRVEAGLKVAAFAVPYPQIANDWLMNTVDSVYNGMKPQPQDILKRRPVREQ